MEVTCLGVVIDRELKFALHIRRLAGRYFYQLRQLCSMRRSLNTNVTKRLVNAFITSRVDYFKCFQWHWCSPSLSNLVCSKCVRNADSARLIVKKRKYDQITATIRDELLAASATKTTINSATSSRSAFTRVHHHIYHQCALVLVRLRVVVIFAQQPVVTWLSYEETIKRMDHAASRLLIYLCEICFHLRLESLI